MTGMSGAGTVGAGLFRRGARSVIGVVHLAALPGAPGWGGDFAAILDRARADLLALAAGGVDAAVVENFGDVPFRAGAVEPETVAAMARVLTELRPLTALPLGVNVLRNDAAAALALAAICGGADSFIRVNVHSGAMITDQGVIEGRADRTLRRRRDRRDPGRCAGEARRAARPGHDRGGGARRRRAWSRRRADRHRLRHRRGDEPGRSAPRARRTPRNAIARRQWRHRRDGGRYLRQRRWRDRGDEF